MVTTASANDGHEVRSEAKGEFEQQHANDVGLTYLELENAWWGKESVGEWGDQWWAVVTASTEKALLLGKVSDKAAPQRRDLKTPTDDAWVPKSKVTRKVEPDWEVHSPEGEVEGTLTLQKSRPTKYGPKHEITGDTYAAFKKDGLDGKLVWDKTHATFNGNAWEIDASELARGQLRHYANELGYEVRVLP